MKTTLESHRSSWETGAVKNLGRAVDDGSRIIEQAINLDKCPK